MNGINQIIKKIMFILKEAYNDKKTPWSLTDWLRDRDNYPSMWKRVAEWAYAIQNTDIKNIANPKDIADFDNDKIKSIINKIAVINIKKSNGGKISNIKEINLYAKEDKDELTKQIEMIDPDIIVCGYTIEALDILYDNKIKKDVGINYYGSYVTEAIGNRERIVLDYYHPANRWPRYINFYAIAHVYQEALKIKSNK